MATINLGSIKFNWKGAFNNSTAYAVDDVVSSGGNSYVCIQASQGNAVGNATAYWNIMSTKGTNGTNGTDLSSLLSTRGDLVFKNASALARLAKGTEGQVLGQGANDPAWVNGSAKTLTTRGDLLYRNASTIARLPKGTNGYFLKQGANDPIWAEAPSGKVHQALRSVNSSVVSSSNDLGGKNFPNNKAYGNGAQVCVINITPVSLTSHFYAWYSEAAGVGSNAVSVSAIFFDTTRGNLGSANSYANDVGGINVHAIFNVPGSGQVTVQARNLGSHNGGTHYTNSDQSGNTNGGQATLTVIEIED